MLSLEILLYIVILLVALYQQIEMKKINPKFETSQ